jgi:hypothetical protein
MAKGKKTGPLRLYKSYVFRDKDPIIDQVRTVVQKSQKTYTKISEDSGVSAGTLGNWFGGTTKRPQFASMNAVLRSCGHEFVIREKLSRK